MLAVCTAGFGVLWGTGYMTSHMTAHAQSLPGMTVRADDENQGRSFNSSIPMPSDAGNTTFPRMEFGLRNQYFTDITTIQYQISLLEILIKRQEKNKEIGESFKQIGIPHKEPAPPRSVCEELPVNLLCGRFYPELYGLNKPLTPVSRQGLDDFIAGRTPPTLNTGPVEEAPKPKGFNPPYEWADISCAYGSCKATLVQTEGRSHRLTVFEGSALKDGLSVKTISFNRVVIVSDKGESKEITPHKSPDKGGVVSPIFTRAAAPTAIPANALPAGSTLVPVSNAATGSVPAVPAQPVVADPVSSPDVEALLKELNETEGQGLPDEGFQIIDRNAPTDIAPATPPATTPAPQ